ncbi:MAG TPA: cellulase family glycosylhydrolase [Planctomycetota bacterium]|nr:cellulase family glycosylhydrolase [Planctomycetota bacterium]
MRNQVSAIWLPIAILVALLAYWAGRAGAPDRAGDEAKARPAPTPTESVGTKATTAQPPTRPDTATAVLAPPAPSPDTSTPAAGAGISGLDTQPPEEEPWRQPETEASVPPLSEPYRQPETPAWDTGRTPDLGTNGTRPSWGDTTTPAVARPAEELATAFDVLDGFEDGNAWAVESAADHAALALAEEQVSEGQKALKATWKAFGKGNFELRREMKLDLTNATRARVDVYNDGGPLDLVLGLRAGYDASLFTTPPQPLEKGWNKDITFRLGDLSVAEKGSWGSSWSWNRDSVNRVSLIFRERDEKEGAVHVDNLRFDHPAAKLGARVKPAIKSIRASAGTLERFETLELAVAFDAACQNFFDRAEVDLTASFLAPSGKRCEVKGFVYEADAPPDGQTAGRPAWRIRFTPTEVGLWRYDVTVKDAGGETTSQTYEFLCRQGASRAGFIRVSKSDPQYFEFDNASFYYPIGQNICWAANYEYYLDQMKAYGGNHVRVWLCPWNLQLEDPKELGKYDLAVAKAIDTLLEQCRARGIYVQLVLRYHGMQDASWDKNPYNTVNGGPCTWAGDFFTDSKAKEFHKRFLDYVAARWGASPTLFAWELWNEVDLTRADRESDVVAWHREMAAHLKKADAHGHLVTTSVSSPGRCAGLFEVPEIDFIPIHLYTRDLAEQFQSAWLHYRKLRKPMFISEFSAGIKPGDDLGDERGIHLHAGLWLAFVGPFAGNAMPWWWDTFVDKNKLYSHWAVLSKFANGVDRRGRNYELVVSQVKLSDEATVNIQGLVAPSEALLWVFDEARIVRPEHADRPLLFAERPVRLHGMLGGKFRVEVWDTLGGTLVSEAAATTDDGTLSLVLPKSSRPLAVKVTQETPGKALPRIEW